MANNLTALLPKILARGLMSLREQALMTRLVNTDYSTEAAQKGDTINVPIPTAMVATDVTPAATPPALGGITPTTVPISLSNWKESRFHLTDKEQTEIDKNAHFLPMQVQEALRALVNAINASVHAKYLGIYGYVGTAGTTPFATTAAAAIDARKVLNRQLAPKDNRRGVLNFDAEANALALAVFADAGQTMESGVKIKGEIGEKYGINWFAEDEVPTHTLGAAGTVLVDQADVEIGDTTVHFDGLTTKASVGDIFTVAGDTQTYVVTAASDLSTTDGDMTFQPPAKVAWANDAAVTFKATHVVNPVFHRDAFALAMRPLAKSSVDPQLQSVMTDPVTGLSLRLEVSRVHKADAWSFDALWGTELVRPALACRIAG